MKKLALLLLISCSSLFLHAQVNETRITIDFSKLKTRIDKNIYGHFSEHLGSCIYGGIWVGENSKIPNTKGIRNDVVKALKRIKVPVLRWPGGCFADEYHWKDGIGPNNKRPSMINTNWGGVTEDNSFGTHEFLEFCNLIGAEPYFSGNLGSGTVQELSQWVEYVNSDNVSPMTNLRKENGREKSWGVKYWGIGNESWGCGGNMTAQFYSDQLKKYTTYMHNYGQNRLYKIAVGPYGDNYEWTETVMKNGGFSFSGLSLHYYTFYNQKTATDINAQDWFNVMKTTLNMEEIIKKNIEIMDKHDPNNRVALIVDEWGGWYQVEPGTNPGFLYQQNTMRDAILAATNLNIFNNYAHRVKMANVAQMVNVLQAVILTKDEKMVLTPTYYVFDLYKVHQDALLVNSSVESSDYVNGNDKIPAVNVSSSLDKNNKLHISLTNINPLEEEAVAVNFIKYDPKRVTGQIITSSKMNAHNTFDNPEEVKSASFSDFKLNDGNLEIQMPPMSVVVLELEGNFELPGSIELKKPKQGIKTTLYEGEWDLLPDFDKLNPVSSSVTEQINLPKDRLQNYGVKYEGYIKIPKDNLYTFFINNDDGAVLFINDEPIINNDGLHAPEEMSNSIILKAGYHKIKVVFFQK
ncbi:MAG TPA: alpha-L-arabinofuranosidase C-terminal domain-containing protein, partial [Ignavibacteriaceae bacterium]|nr:alpha-L-arabinofuranosidase C-terminal domain-containing protein [Ignavibacteriaceae bacterium]